MGVLVDIDGDYYDSDMIDELEQAFVKTDKTDAVLVVNKRKLHVNKAILSYHSDYFKTLFNSEFKEKSMEEIEIKDVYYVNFARLLSLVHDTPVAITDANTEYLLILADRFLFRAPKLQIEHFIIHTQDFSRRQKLILADKYNLENLLKHAIGLYNNRAAFQDFHSPYTRKFSDTLRLKMFDEFFDKYSQSL
ncbi:hypothetical protein CAEBREN_23346 [Caenorhabditis brenneri]|uniref:BTB domain-containing protein n=1 Tax=Caenorhabditis brenneri TaxID=135651 RepID=G0MVY7_CAEBE|nr:hypothetical protein CAEBREN_23346 [Caenorhabditis brenneri]